MGNIINWNIIVIIGALVASMFTLGWREQVSNFPMLEISFRKRMFIISVDAILFIGAFVLLFKSVYWWSALIQSIIILPLVFLFTLILTSRKLMPTKILRTGITLKAIFLCLLILIFSLTW